MSLAVRLAAQSSGIINYNNIAALSGLNYRNLKKNLNILEETFVIQEVKPFFVNKMKELSKNPKIYFTDNGFRNSLIEDMRLPDKRTDAGALAENTVLIRLKELSGGLNPVNFWRTKAGSEVDFLIKIKGKEVPVEVKFSPFSHHDITRSFGNYIEAFNPERGVILTKNYWGIEKRGKTTILFAPVYYL